MVGSVTILNRKPLTSESEFLYCKVLEVCFKGYHQFEGFASKNRTLGFPKSSKKNSQGENVIA